VLVFIGAVPERIMKKAESIVSSHGLCVGDGWRKITSLQGWYSYRLNKNYRLLRSINGYEAVCNHDNYQKKIRGLTS
jgi:hypothetical protein